MGRGRRLRIHGRVQGVGFRAFVWREAGALGLDGWVRNRSDGTVEAFVWGDVESVALLVSRIAEGPRWGKVDRVDEVEEPGESQPPVGFSIRSDC